MEGKSFSCLHIIELKSMPGLLLQSSRQGLFRKFHADLLKCSPYPFPRIIQYKHFSSDRHFERSKCRTKANDDKKHKLWTMEMNGWISQKMRGDTSVLHKRFCLCDYSLNASEIQTSKQPSSSSVPHRENLQYFNKSIHQCQSVQFT